jgi:3D (Asp-Asp-Asp) domain-containing protein
LAAAQEKYKAFQAAKCSSGPICEIACLAYTQASCASQTTATGTVFRCTGTQGVTTN